ncbi:MAG: sulfurtransferase-like selenium metabolism protein YedF [Candidatus Aegiribacteria sp.]|nr:sulfurtransferase-like selenium metabolism protein YedF [Candidatus Aegiribacteria sp.]
MSEIYNARGLPCPKPVLMAKNFLDEGKNDFSILVSGSDQAENVMKFAHSRKHSAEIVETNEGFRVSIGAPAPSMKHVEKSVQKQEKTISSPVVMTITSCEMGFGDKVLGEVLIRALFHTLTEMDESPDTIVFYNGGVRLTVEGSPVLEDLSALEKNGVELLVCGTCLGHFGLTDSLAVGRVSNMYAIAETLFSAGKLVTV